ncbi:pickpocket protein 28-like [Maniola jurtina]|uniref:pickpocket protein 28-like n=1 Tax=Maniola jurtina TaxID=191418 RepID=UPI001E68A8F2|nr:pickpocket protein 28-like [Maniola jurtina]
MEVQLRNQCDINIIEVASLEQDKDQPDDVETTKVKRNKKKSITQHLLKCFDNFNLSSKEVNERERTPIEKIVWLIMFLLCFSYCGCLIWKSYWKWMKSPAIVLLTENADSIYKIPFPAVTVCPERKIKSSVFSFTQYNDLYENNKTYGNFTEKQLHMYQDMNLICDFDTKLEGQRFSLGNETVSNIRKASPELSSVILRCNWKGKGRWCQKMFTPILTEEGVCYTFNTIGPEDLFQTDNLNTDYKYMYSLSRTRLNGWTPKEGYARDAPETTYPERSIGAGAKAGLKLFLGEDVEGLDTACMGMVSGFKILLHHPTELPRLSQQYIRIPIYEEVTIAFTPKKIVTSNGLRVFPPDRRQCYFTGERNLKYFKLYTQSNCEFECLTNFTYARCGCVGFSMPHGPDMKICNIGSRNCSNNAEIELYLLRVNSKLEPGSSNVTVEEAIQVANDCMCLSTCTSISYESEISQLELDTDQKHLTQITSAIQLLVFNKYKRSKVSTVVIFFKRSQFDISKRSELYSTSDILASCGGLLGLFMGFSVINVFETLYFCILRAYRQRQIEAKNRVDSNEDECSVEKY